MGLKLLDQNGIEKEEFLYIPLRADIDYARAEAHRT